MDQYVASVMVAIITGIFSVVVILVQKRQDKVINELDEKTTFIDKESEVKKRLYLKEKEREKLMYEIMILVLETNLLILKNTDGASLTDQSFFERSKTLHDNYDSVTKNIEEISKEYDLVLEMTAQIRSQLEKIPKKKK